MKNPLVSIIVPCYKVEKYLDRCLECLVNQTLHDIEIILVDDCSPDNTPALCDQWAEKDSRIKVIHKAVNEGLGLACNSGIEHASGDCVAFCDSDDWVDYNCYAVLYEAMIANESDAVFSGITRVDSNGNIISVSHTLKLVNYEYDSLRSFVYGMIASDSKTDVERERQMSAKTVLYSGEIIRKFGVRFHSEREIISEDLLFNMDFIRHSTKVTELPISLYNYFINTDSLTTALREDRFRMNVYLRDFLINNYPYYNITSQYIQRVDRMFIGYVRSIISIIVNSSANLTQKRALITEICAEPIWHQIFVEYPIKDLSKIKQIIFYLQFYNKPLVLLSLFEAMAIKNKLISLFTKRC